MTKSDWEGLAQSESTLIHEGNPTAHVREPARARAEIRDLRVKKSPEIMESILQAIREGLPITTAARVNGINPETVYRWRKEDDNFDQGIREAKHFYKAVLISNVVRAAQTDWKASTWLLSREFPNEYGDKKEVQVIATQNNGLAEVIAMIQQTNDSVKPQEDP